MPTIQLSNGQTVSLTMSEFQEYLATIASTPAPAVEPVVEKVEEAPKPLPAAAKMPAKCGINPGTPPPAFVREGTPRIPGLSRGRFTVPVSAKEYEIVQILKKNMEGLTTKQMASMLGIPQTVASNRVSGMFQAERHLIRSSGMRWRLSLRSFHNADWKIVTQPNIVWAQMKLRGEHK